jgi:hypothetical protein
VEEDAKGAVEVAELDLLGNMAWNNMAPAPPRIIAYLTLVLAPLLMAMLLYQQAVPVQLYQRPIVLAE